MSDYSTAIETVSLAGGLFVVLASIHFLVDWVVQTERGAESKSKRPWVLLAHCLVYTAAFIPALYALMPLERLYFALVVLLVSHFIGDLYIPAFLWAKYVRGMTVWKHGQRVPVDHPMDLFPEGEPLNLALLFRVPLFLVIDQIWHLVFIWVVVGLALWSPVALQ